MRKVLSIVLSLAMILGTFSFSFAANITPTNVPSDVKGTDFEEAVTVLSNLGIITGYEDGSYKPEGIVNRAEATLIVIKALGMEGSVGSQKSSYTDLSGYGWAEGYIAFATQLGIVNGYGDGTFRPGQTVNYNEFATMLVRALGYTDVSLTGTWPAKYVNQASAVGIMDDVKSGGSTGANRGDVALMANNALTAYIGLVDKDNNWNPIVKSGSVAAGDAVYDTMIGRLGGYFWKGVITDSMDADINIRPYVGHYCEYYTDEEDGKGDIITVSQVKSTMITGNYKDDATGMTRSGVTFEGNDDVDYKIGSNAGEYTVKIGRNYEQTEKTIYFLNGELVSLTPTNVTTESATDISVDLSGKTAKTVYAVMAWVADSAVQVEDGDLTDIKEDQSLLGYDFDTDRNDQIIANSFELIGVDSLDDIKKDNILYVYNAKDDDVIRRVAVGTEVVEGKITKASDTNEEWTIDGKVYSFSDATGADDYTDAEAGDTVKLYLDAYGDIYKVDGVSGSAKDYAIIKNIDDRNEQIRMYLADDSTKTYDYDLDKKDINAVKQYYTTDKGILVGYSFDSSNTVDSIYPDDDNLNGNADDQKDYTDTLAIKNASTVRLLSNKVLEYDGKQVTIDNNVVVFTVDSDDNLDVSKIEDVDKKEDAKDLNDGTTNKVQALVRDGDVVALFVDDKYVSGSSQDDVYAVISSADSATNSVGDKALELSGFANGKKMNGVYTSSKSTVDNARVSGNVYAYKLKYNDDGDVSKAEEFDPDGGNAALNGGMTVTDGSMSISKGYVKVASGSAVVTKALSKDFAAYELTVKNGKVDEYKSFSGTIKDGYKAWFFDMDDDNAGFEIVVIYRD